MFCVYIYEYVYAAILKNKHFIAIIYVCALAKLCLEHGYVFYKNYSSIKLF